jgi:hypothetical protein
MRWHLRRKLSVPVAEIEIAAEDRLKLGHVYDPTLSRLFAAIDEVAPETAVLYLEGTRIPTEIREFLEQRSVSTGAVPTAGTIFPRPAKFHMPLRKENLRQLRALAQGYGLLEACDHVVVYEGDRVLLDAYDAGDGEVHVNRQLLPPERIARLREILRPPANN